MILQRSPCVTPRGCVAAVLAATAFSAAVVRGGGGQSGVAADRAALEALYDAAGGENWTNSANWKTDAPLSAWHGVTADADGRVTGLSLGENGLAGPIPDALGSLANLQSLYLSGNELSGPIPDALGRLANLQSLYLWGNALSGPIPDALGRLANLQSLHLSGNELSGPIPDALGSLANLFDLDLRGNELSGPIPDWLGRLANLQFLVLGDNGLSGPIPDALGRANLELLDLSYAWGLSGPLPSGLRSAASLADLDIFVTQACAPAAWRDWLKTIDFEGRLCGDEAAATVDVAVVHTPAAREAAGGAAEIAAVVDLMIAETNQVYEASGVRHRVALAGRSEVQYVESGDSDLNRLAEPSDGHMDEAHALRDRVGADLVYLIVDPDKASFGGGAQLGGAFGFLTVHPGIGTTFAHELGHNFGLLHDRYQMHHYEGGTGPHPAYGYVNQSGLRHSPRSRRWLTIMAYDTQCYAEGLYLECLYLSRFSNPRQQYGGDPLGVPFGAGGSGATGPADAAAVLDATMPAAALWRDRASRATAPPVRPRDRPRRPERGPDLHGGGDGAAQPAPAPAESRPDRAMVTASFRVYWRNGDRIQRAGVDGSRLEDVVTGLHADRCEVAGCGLAVDSAAGKLYWTSSDHGAGGVIRRANLDGSGIEDLVTTAADGVAGLLHAGNLALDVDGRKMYWVDWGHGEIRRADLDGSGIETVIPNGDWIDPVQGDGFTLDVAAGHLYYVTRGGLRRARLDGSRVEDLSESFPFGRPRDVAAGRLYWTHSGVRGGRAGIRRADLDGWEVEDLVTDLRRPADLAVDAAGGKLYWTDWLTGRVQRANLDGSRVEDLVTGLRFPDAVALEWEPARRR